MKTEAEEWREERERIERRRLHPTLADRIARAWFAPRDSEAHTYDPDMFRTRTVEELLERGPK